MLPKKFRISADEFYHNSSSPRKLQGEILSVSVKKGRSVYPKAVILVPKRIDKRATARHIMKRTIIEAIRPLMPKLPTRVEIAVKVNRFFSKKEKQVVAKELTQLLLLNEDYTTNRS